MQGNCLDGCPDVVDTEDVGSAVKGESIKDRCGIQRLVGRDAQRFGNH